ncbi:helix-turn-helix domain-containing protein [Staphylococcus nepalensis]|uniref:helix-turn-helix domain-containing protein n=1 Tax=Staphylococcus nepalensis TaxID=214473 RepID=UPI001A992A43|nr:helix-turn-helix transcriptional regulator [Staphylococcus nepalensis]MBO1222552.1 helix-turn-helix transcriptional regulator [Staphylococcus nepalensis]
MALNSLLKEQRKEKGFTMKELANKSGISESYISKIENNSVSLPKKERLLSLAYSLDPENKENLYSRFLTLASYNLENAEKEFNQFANMKQANLDKGLPNKKFTDNFVRIDKKNSKINSVEYPYFDLEWLLNQERFELFLGRTDVNILLDNNEIEKELLILKDHERDRLKNIINIFKEGLLNERTKISREKDENVLISHSHEYTLIFDLLNKNIDDRNSLISQLGMINQNRDVFYEDNYYSAINQAVEQQDALKLQRLVRMTTINELKQYLSEQNRGD